MTKKYFDYATFFYKLFLLILIIAQIHLIYYHEHELHLIGEIISYVLLFYLIFRFYLLHKLGKQAKYLSITLAQFLQKRKEFEDNKKNGK